MKTICISLLFLFSFLSLNGQNMQDIMFKHLTIKENLAHYSVMALYQDERGLIWIGTRNGVNVYDGNEMHVYKQDGDTDGNILSNSVRDITGDKNGKIYFLTIRGISCFDLEKETFATLTQNTVAAMCYDKQLYIGLENKVYAYNGSRFVPSYELPETDAKIFSLSVSGDSLLIGTEEHGLYIYRQATDSLSHPIATGKVVDIFKDSRGRCWVGTYFGGVSYFNPKLDFYKQYMVSKQEGAGLSFPVVGEMTEDSQYNLWICTEGGGLNMLDRKTGKFKWYRHTSAANSISHNNVKSIYYDKEREAMWVGTHLGGLNKLDLRTGKFTRYVCGERGKISDKANIVCDIIPHEESLLLATHDGVYRFDIHQETFHPLFKSGKEGAIIHLALDLKIDHQGVLWIAGVEKGAYSYDFVTGKLTAHAHTRADKTGLSSNGVNCMYPGSGNRLWFCMAESGLDLYN